LRTIGVGGSEYVPIYGGEAVSSGGSVTGRLRSCVYGFTVRRNLAYSYLPIELKPGEQVEVEVFGQMVPAVVLPDKTFAAAEEKHHAS
jgi:glycine cleavage system aminomethyltransferase T